jgi:hypothetical protein
MTYLNPAINTRCPLTGNECEGRVLLAEMCGFLDEEAVRVEIEDIGSRRPPRFLSLLINNSGAKDLDKERAYIQTVRSKVAGALDADPIACEGTACGSLVYCIGVLASTKEYEIQVARRQE